MEAQPAPLLRFKSPQGDKNNAGLAALAAVQKIKNLYALELGNEPNCAALWDPQSPEVGGKPWTPEADAASQTMATGNFPAGKAK
ncbi:hypothetical protein H4Q26_012420 [Puccinia striiformis f. sp. tritici PST-130]|nr:hypothetical protein H4Q26_012420 [Puccinia striiformis f. sp. tritici PST-130]